jgi:cytochrome c oxidase subunit 2
MRAPGVQTRRAGCLLPIAIALLTGCSGPQSALDPASDDAARLSELFWVLAIAAGLIWASVVGVAIYAARTDGEHRSRKLADRLIGIGGGVLPTLALAVLLSYGLTLLPQAGGRAADLRIAVAGEQWWWRVTYLADGDGGPVPSANELRLPVGRTAEIELTSPDVIHSFWIPPLAGKVDMIPGRTNRIVLTPTRTGTFRGVCAEYCGLSHALMAFPVIVMEQVEFEAWLRRARDADGAAGRAEAGFASFAGAGCGACHTVRGTPAQGTIGPDLTRMGARRTIGAGTLPNTPDNMRRWIARAEHIKPGSFMPSFSMLGEAEIAAIAEYLAALD